MEDQTRSTLKVETEKVILAAVMLPNMIVDPNDPLGELRSLAETAGAVVVDELMQNRSKPDSATFMGSGKVEELAELVVMHGGQAVIFDNDLTPRQIANIEKIVLCKVLDRSELILDIFAGRASTYEAKLQVELAQLEYTYPRLRAMWTHLERITGGAPAGIGTRGPGEQQLEIDRRIVQRKKSDLLKEIRTVQSRKEREVAARNIDFYTVGLVGYTNAGKSTLFNTLTGAEVYADDKLFATLDTRTRKWTLGGGDNVMLSDTVGFVRDLPHHLVASFRATLEEAIHCDMLLVVLDVAHPRARQQLDTVMEVLDDIGAKDNLRVLVLNKIDALDHNADLLVMQREFPDAIPISAKTGRGVDRLVEFVREHSQGLERELHLSIPLSDGRAMSFIESRTDVLERRYDANEAVYHVKVGKRQVDQLLALSPNIRLVEPTDP